VQPSLASKEHRTVQELKSIVAKQEATAAQLAPQLWANISNTFIQSSVLRTGLRLPVLLRELIDSSL
jgi:hypothetical protein